MTEREAQRSLRKMLKTFTPGSILHLLAEAIVAHAPRNRRAASRADERAATLFVVGLGIDAVPNRRDRQSPRNLNPEDNA